MKTKSRKTISYIAAAVVSLCCVCLALTALVANTPTPQTSIPPTIDLEEVRRRADQLAQRLELITPNEQRALLRAYIESIIVDRIEEHLYSTINYYPPLEDNGPPTPPNDPDPTTSDPTQHLPHLSTGHTVRKSPPSVEAHGFTHSINFEHKIVQVREKRNKKRPA